MAGTLHVVATPIGNLADCSERLRATLAACAVVLCEDTRRSGTLLRHLGVTTPLLTCHEHDERRRIPAVLARLRAGEDVALVSDAGTPAISDPGYRLVAAVVDAGLRVSPVAGPSSVTAALSVSGLPTDSFAFEGFLPRRRGPRRRLLASLEDEPRTLVLLETPQRLAESLADLVEAFGPARRAVLARELTKLHEEIVHAPLGALAERFAEPTLGEVVLVIEGQRESPAASTEGAAERVAELVAGGCSEKDALRAVARERGLHRRDLYRLVKVRGQDDSADDDPADEGAGGAPSG